MGNKKVVVGAVLSLGVLGGLAIAANPHFLTASATRQGNDLVIKFKEAGLGNNQTVTIQVSAHATAEYWCINKGGKNPAAENKRTVESDVATSGEFTSDRNGSINGTLTLSAPAPDFECPRGQRRVLQSLSYTDVQITDVTNDVSKSISGTF